MGLPPLLKWANFEFPITETRTFIAQYVLLNPKTPEHNFTKANNLGSIAYLTVPHSELNFKHDADLKITQSDAFIIMCDRESIHEKGILIWLCMFWRSPEIDRVYVSSLASKYTDNIVLLNGLPLSRTSGFLLFPNNGTLQIKNKTSLFSFSCIEQNARNPSAAVLRAPVCGGYLMESLICDLILLQSVNHLKQRLSTLKVQTVNDAFLANILYVNTLDKSLLDAATLQILNDPFLFKKPSNQNMRRDIDKEFTMRPASLIASASNVCSPATALAIEVMGIALPDRERLVCRKLLETLKTQKPAVFKADTPPLSPYMQSRISPTFLVSDESSRAATDSLASSPVHFKTPVASAQHSRRTSSTSATMVLRPSNIVSSNPLTAFHFKLVPESEPLESVDQPLFPVASSRLLPLPVPQQPSSVSCYERPQVAFDLKTGNPESSNYKFAFPPSST